LTLLELAAPLRNGEKWSDLAASPHVSLGDSKLETAEKAVMR
jgi:hypothetical protein